MADVEDKPKVEGAEEPKEALAGTVPKPDVSYPLKVQYCGECTLPLEYCAFGGRSEACKTWLDKNLAQLVADGATIEEEAEGDEKDEKKRQKRGGKGTNVKTVKVGSILDFYFSIFKEFLS